MLEYYALCGIIVFLMALIVFREIIQYRQIEKLTNKIIAENFRDYSLSNLEIERERTKRIKPQEKTQSYRV